MLNPSPGRLLTSVADSLDETVLPTMDRGPARNQVQAAIGVVRRCAITVENFGPVLHAECVDLTRTVRSVTNADNELFVDRTALGVTLAKAEAVLAESYPSVPALVEAVLSLHAVVADVAVAVEQLESRQRAPVRALLQRMTERQAALGLSPW